MDAMQQEPDPTGTGRSNTDFTNTELINAIALSLTDRSDGDKDLTDILVKHILTTEPTQDALKEAVEEIVELATQLAKESCR